MKKQKMWFVVIALLLLCNFSQAQQSIVSKEDFAAKRAYASEKMKTLSHRKISREERIGNNSKAVSFVRETIVESAPSNKAHYLFKSVFGDKILSSELIIIGDKHFTKEGDGIWKETKIGQAPMFQLTKENAIYKYIGVETINNQKADLYETTYTPVVKDDLGSAENQKPLNSVIKRYWFGQDGLTLKSEEIIGNEQSLQQRRTITIYEYDANIRIEEPKLEKLR